MSAGPIKAWRDGHVSPKLSTSNADRVCMATTVSVPSTRTICGRSNARRALTWADVTCADCKASARADGVVIP